MENLKQIGGVSDTLDLWNEGYFNAATLEGGK
jgi:hypothetical protein